MALSPLAQSIRDELTQQQNKAVATSSPIAEGASAPMENATIAPPTLGKQISGELSEQVKKDSDMKAAEDAAYDRADELHDDNQSLFGSAVISGKVGIKEYLPSLADAALRLGSHMPYAPQEEISKEREFIRNYVDQVESDPEFQKAQVTHKITSEGMKGIGVTAPDYIFPFARIERATAATYKLAAEMYAPTLKWLTKFAPSAARATTATAIGYTLPQDELSSTESNVAGAAAANVIVGPVFGKIIQGIAGDAHAIYSLAKSKGISIPIWNIMEKMLTYLPFSPTTSSIGKASAQAEAGLQAGLGEVAGKAKEAFAGAKKTAAEGAAKIRGKAQGTFNATNKDVEDYAKQLIMEFPENKDVGKNYGEYLSGQMKEGYENAVAEAGQLSAKIGNLTRDGGGVRTPITRNLIDDNLKEMQELPESAKDIEAENTFKYYQEQLNLDQDYPTLNLIRQKIGEKIGQLNAQTGLGFASRALLRAYKSLYSGITTDMQNFADNAAPAVRDLHNQVRDIVQNRIAPFSQANYAKLLDTHYDSDSFIGEFLNPDSPQKLSKMLSLTADKGALSRLAARAAILQQALDNASVNEAIGFNGGKFVDEVLKLGKTNDVLFSKEHMDVMKGYKKTLDYLKPIFPSLMKQRVASANIDILFSRPDIAEKIGINAEQLNKVKQAKELVKRMSPYMPNEGEEMTAQKADDLLNNPDLAKSIGVTKEQLANIADYKKIKEHLAIHFPEVINIDAGTKIEKAARYAGKGITTAATAGAAATLGGRALEATGSSSFGLAHIPFLLPLISSGYGASFLLSNPAARDVMQKISKMSAEQLHKEMPFLVKNILKMMALKTGAAIAPVLYSHGGGRYNEDDDTITVHAPKLEPVGQAPTQSTTED